MPAAVSGGKLMPLLRESVSGGKLKTPLMRVGCLLLMFYGHLKQKKRQLKEH
jgi:hypothetical protein